MRDATTTVDLHAEVFMKFSQALLQTDSIIAYAEFHNIIEIDRDGNVLLDFGV